MADVVHAALLVEEPEQQRSERRSIVGFAPSDHDAISRALVLDLHPESLARDVSPGPRLGDHAVEPCSLESLKPALGGGVVSRVGRQEDRLLDPLEQALEPLAPLTKRQLAQVGATFGQDVERDKPSCRWQL